MTTTAVATPGRARPSPMGGPAVAAPPAWIPLTFLAASGVGLVLFGVAAALSAQHIASPTHPGMVAAVHSGMLGFLSTGVLGALHQFAPVVGNRPLRSTRAAAVTMALFLPGVWTLAGGFAHGPSWLVPAGGITATTAILLATWNLSGALSSTGKGVPLAGLRMSVAFLVLTASFGVLYAIDRETGWFPLLPTRVLAHAHLGLLGWLGMSYVAVAEKLWPMFLLAHRPGARSGAVAVSGLGAGTPLVAVGLLGDWPVVTFFGGAAVVTGLGAHLVSLVGTIRARRRRLELLHGYVVSSAAFLVAAIALGVTAGLAPISTTWRIRVVSGEVMALTAWLGLALLGHAHKVVPFIVWTKLRIDGRMPKGGKPLLFGDLFRNRAAQVTLGLAVGGFALALAGVLSATPGLFGTGAAVAALAGALAVWNLSTGPALALARRSATPDEKEAVTA